MDTGSRKPGWAVALGLGTVMVGVLFFVTSALLLASSMALMKMKHQTFAQVQTAAGFNTRLVIYRIVLFGITGLSAIVLGAGFLRRWRRSRVLLRSLIAVLLLMSTIGLVGNILVAFHRPPFDRRAKLLMIAGGVSVFFIAILAPLYWFLGTEEVRRYVGEASQPSA